MTAEDTFWERLSPRAQVAGPLATIEDPETVVRLGLFTLIGAGVSTAGFAVLFFAFIEPAAGGSTLALALAFFLSAVSPCSATSSPGSPPNGRGPNRSC